MFWHRLALQLGKSVRQAKLEIDSLEFTYWQAYFGIEPWGEAIADLRHGNAMALTANINRDAKKRPEPYKADDFIYWRDTGRQEENAAPVLLDDPVAQADLIRAVMFGITPEGK